MIQRLSNLLGQILPQRVIDHFVNITSSRKILLLIAGFTIAWLVIDRFMPHPFDDWRAGYPYLVLFFTLYFGIDAGVTKVVQAEVAKKEQERAQQLLDIAKELRRIARKSVKTDASILLLAKTVKDLGMRILDRLGHK